MHLTGDYVANDSSFSSTKWLPTTDFYLEKIQNDLSSENWTAIFQALHDLKESCARDERIKVGAPSTPEQREVLLPEDPPTPSPLD